MRRQFTQIASGYRTEFPVVWPDSQRPMLVVTVDTEEEFDWSRPLARTSRGVSHAGAIPAAHRVFDRHEIRPTYLVDYAVASQEASAGLLSELARDGRCEIGAHLHPWVNPPDDEDVTPANSYPGNLPAELERAKLERLTDMIVERLGVRPTAYRAGRYGFGPNTAETLRALGYRIDTSVVPHTEFNTDGGPDFAGFPDRPYWLDGERRLLEVPLSVGFCGALRSAGKNLYDTLRRPAADRLHMGGLFARLRLIERIRLSPEGMSLRDLVRLTDTLLAAGHKVFNLSFHSPSLAPGHTPYVRTQDDHDRFLATLDAYFDHFLGARGGQAGTLSDVRTLAEKAA
jgi:peptidoglycan/xylan/chitin deacetylase (PgdA/CDA1 family)